MKELRLVHRHKEDSFKSYVEKLEGYAEYMGRASNKRNILAFTGESGPDESSSTGESSALSRKRGAFPGDAGGSVKKRGKNKAANKTTTSKTSSEQTPGVNSSSSSSSSSTSDHQSQKHWGEEYVTTSDEDYKSWLECQRYSDKIIQYLLLAKQAAEARGDRVTYYRGKGGAPASTTTSWHKHGQSVNTHLPENQRKTTQQGETGDDLFLAPQVLATTTDEENGSSPDVESVEKVRYQQRVDDFFGSYHTTSSADPPRTFAM